MGETGGDPRPMTELERAIVTSMDNPEGPIEPIDIATVLSRIYRTAPNDFFLEVAKGNILGNSAIHKFGRNEDVDTANDADIWDAGRTSDAVYTYVYPTAARIHDLSSSSPNDAYPSGSGARRVLVLGLDTNFNEQSEIVNLVGGGNAPTANAYSRIFRMIVIEAGSGGFNAGDVVATAQVDSSISAQINTGNNQTLMAIYTIPNGKTGYMLKYYISANKQVAVDIDFFLFQRPNGQVFQLKHILGGHSRGGTPYSHEYKIPPRLDARTDIRLRVSVSGNSADVSAGFEILLVND